MTPQISRFCLLRVLCFKQNCQAKLRGLSTQNYVFTREKPPGFQRLEYKGRRSIMTNNFSGPTVCHSKVKLSHAPYRKTRNIVQRLNFLAWRQIASHAGWGPFCLLFKIVSGEKPRRKDSFARSTSNASTCSVELAELVIERTQSSDVMARSLRVAEVATLIASLQHRGFTEDAIKEMLSKRLWLLQQKDSTVQVIDLLQAQGFTLHHIQEFFEYLPFPFQSSLAVVLDTVNTAILNLRSRGFSEADLWALTQADPRVLLIDPNTVTSSLDSLKQLFRIGEAKSILIQNPRILAEPFSEVWSKFEYVHFVMGYAQDQMLRSRLFSHNLRHIQDRHMFLSRVGFFVHVKTKMDPNLNPNPPLKQVLDTSDEKFASMFGGMTAQEYKVFRKMRQIEREEEDKAAREFEGDYEEDDSDDDVHDNNYAKKSERKRYKRGKK